MFGNLAQSIFLEMFGSQSGGRTQQLADLVDSSDRINYGVVQPGEDDPDGIYLVRVSDIKNGRVSHSNLRKVSKQINTKDRRSVLKGNEILISCVGSIGEIAITSDAEIGFNIARAVARIPLCEKILRVYVAEYLRSPTVQRYFTKELRTVSQPTLNIKQISEAQINIPSESKLKEFDRRVRSIGDGLKLAQSQSSRFDFLFTSLQSRAFSGQL
jgi:type I restriction enzyme, S subunit